jgi:NAD(P)-dependent dehydrogenase (short-subunit alcohol dehydrogenase family)
MTYNPMDLTGRAVLVTGASSGLGRATAILVSRLGGRVLLVARNSDRLAETLQSMEGDGHALLSFDLNDTEAIPKLVAEQAATFGPFAGLVHAAGVVLLKPLRMCRSEDYESIYRINVVAAAQLLRGLTMRRGVIAANGCSAVIVGSVMSVLGKAGLGAYAASKAAVLGLVRTAALELARDGVRANAVVPGHFQSEMAERNQTQLLPEQMQAIRAMHPLGIGRSEDVANAIAFLLADTSRWITGSALVVDGGYSIE